jgi:hypothetical protein
MSGARTVIVTASALASFVIDIEPDSVGEEMTDEEFATLAAQKFKASVESDLDYADIRDVSVETTALVVTTTP